METSTETTQSSNNGNIHDNVKNALDEYSSFHKKLVSRRGNGRAGGQIPCADYLDVMTLSHFKHLLSLPTPRGHSYNNASRTTAKLVARVPLHQAILVLEEERGLGKDTFTRAKVARKRGIAQAESNDQSCAGYPMTQAAKLEQVRVVVKTVSRIFHKSSWILFNHWKEKRTENKGESSKSQQREADGSLEQWQDVDLLVEHHSDDQWRRHYQEIKWAWEFFAEKILMSKNSFAINVGNIQQGHDLIRSLVTRDRLPETTELQGLLLLRDAWCEYDVIMYLAGRYKRLSKGVFLAQLVDRKSVV